MKEHTSLDRALPPEATKSRYYCDTCRTETQHRVLTLVNHESTWTDGPNSGDWSGVFKTVICLGCENVSFAKESTSSEDWTHDEENNVVFPPTIERFPAPVGRLPIPHSNLLPPTLRDVYDETLGAYNADLRLLGAIGVRGLIEMVCKNKNAPGASLHNKIEALIPLGLLTSEHAAILHKLRTLGNSAAHEAVPPSKKHLGLAIDVCEHLLQGVYVIPHQASAAFGSPEIPDQES